MFFKRFKQYSSLLEGNEDLHLVEPVESHVTDGHHRPSRGHPMLMRVIKLFLLSMVSFVLGITVSTSYNHELRYGKTQEDLGRLCSKRTAFHCKLSPIHAFLMFGAIVMALNDVNLQPLLTESRIKHRSYMISIWNTIWPLSTVLSCMKRYTVDLDRQK